MIGASSISLWFLSAVALFFIYDQCKRDYTWLVTDHGELHPLSRRFRRVMLLSGREIERRNAWGRYGCFEENRDVFVKELIA